MSVAESVSTRINKIQPLVDKLNGAEFVARLKDVRREAGRDGETLSSHRQDGSAETHRLQVR